MMSETRVYLLTKRYLRGAGWEIVGGQPPNGTDSFPVIEISSPSVTEKGSKGSFKPDLIAVRRSDWVMTIIECKPAYSQPDVQKLAEAILPDRLKLLYRELNQRGIPRRLNWPIPESGLVVEKIRPCVAYFGTSRAGANIAQIVFSQNGDLLESSLD